MDRAGQLPSVFGFQIHKVPVGTVIPDPVTGEEFEVTETSAVVSHRACWCTPIQYDALKVAALPVR